MTTNFIPAQRVASMQSSSTLAVLQKAENLRRAGYEVYDLGAGEPDFNTPNNIKLAAHKAIDENFTRYTPAAGTVEIKRAIIDYIAANTGANYNPQQVVVSAGGKQTIFNAIVTLINPGDDVLIPAPYWVTFPEIVTFAGANSVIIDTESNGFQLTAEMVEAHLTPKSRLLILNSPSNPSGRVVDPKEFERIAEVVVKNNLWLLSDECYYQFTYQPHKPFSAASLRDELRARTLVSGSLSKTYAMTGWRLGYALGPQDWIAEMVKVQSHSTSNPASISQKAAIEALSGSQESLKEMLYEYRRRRDYLIPALNQIEGIECVEPEGAFYAFPNVKKVLDSNSKIKSSADLADYLLEEAHIALTAGSAFGTEGYLRISYATSMEILQRAIDKMTEAIVKLVKG
ncbi:MAG: pyridoxal phosphate-dependent aminotransferase [Blastocatellia bacterium]|nr:pyridoxal phosphate-dependent aminotransferase [Blastocatellia bacterium]